MSVSYKLIITSFEVQHSFISLIFNSSIFGSALHFQKIIIRAHHNYMVCMGSFGSHICCFYNLGLIQYCVGYLNRNI